MGYQVRITRELAPSGEPTCIEDTEWDAIVADDAHLRRQSGLSGTNPRTGEVIAVGGDYLIWTGHSEFDEIPFELTSGMAFCKAGSQFDEVLNKLKSLAGLLGAEVMGDDGETY